MALNKMQQLPSASIDQKPSAALQKARGSVSQEARDAAALCPPTPPLALSL